jgi:predicted nucleotidyltransferase
MREDWFKTKFINPRNIAGEPQIEQLEYTRELFEKLGEKDERFSGVAILGSTVKGYGFKDGSDIDIGLFYNEEPKP